jgi:hypothetical protein
MSVQVQVLEYCRAPVVDGVIQGVKIVGTQSRNGRRYPQDVLSRDKAVYEGAAVFMFHPSDPEKRRGSRRLEDHFGGLFNVRERFDGKVGLGLFGDLRVKQSHPMAQMVMESDGHNFGLSHNARVEMNDDQTVVTRIVEVNSVDLVDNPATTKNLFEGTENMELAELKELADKQAERMDGIEGKLDTVLESLKKPDPEPEKKPKRITALESAEPADDQSRPGWPACEKEPRQ